MHFKCFSYIFYIKYNLSVIVFTWCDTVLYNLYINIFRLCLCSSINVNIQHNARIGERNPLNTLKMDLMLVKCIFYVGFFY